MSNPVYKSKKGDAMAFLAQLLTTPFLSGYAENPHHSALEYSLERGGSADASRAARNGVCYLLLNIDFHCLSGHSVDNHSKK